MIPLKACCRCLDLRLGSLTICVISIIQLIYLAIQFEYGYEIIKRFFSAHMIAASLVCIMGAWAISKNDVSSIRIFAIAYSLNAILISGEVIYQPISLSVNKDSVIQKCLENSRDSSIQECELQFKRDILSNTIFSAIFAIVAVYFSIVIYSFYLDIKNYPSKYFLVTGNNPSYTSTRGHPMVSEQTHETIDMNIIHDGLPRYEDVPPPYKAENDLDQHASEAFMNSNVEDYQQSPIPSTSTATDRPLQGTSSSSANP